MKPRTRLPWLMLLFTLALLACSATAFTHGDAFGGIVKTNHSSKSNHTRRPANATSGNRTRLPTLDKKGFSMPKLDLTLDIQVGKSAVAGTAIGLGFLYCFAGIVVYKPILALCGFVIGGVITAKAVMFFAAAESWVAQGSWIGFGVGGLIVAGIIACLGRIIMGMAGGVLIAFTVYVVAASKIHPEQPIMVFYALAVVLGPLMGLLALPCKKPVVILSTSYIGAVMATWGIGHFAGHFPDMEQLTHYESPSFNGNTVVVIPSEWLLYFAAIVVLLILGVIIQYNVTLRFIKRHRWKKYMKSSRKLFGKKFKKHHRPSYEMDHYYAMYGAPTGRRPMPRDAGFFV